MSLLTPDNINNNGWIKDGTTIYYQLKNGKEVEEGHLLDYRNYPISEERKNNEYFLILLKNDNEDNIEITYTTHYVSLSRFDPIL